MAGKLKSLYVCSQCAFETVKWYGKCPNCGEWNSLVEEVRETSKPTVAPNRTEYRVMTLSGGINTAAEQISEIKSDDREIRYHTGMEELDRVLGGGIVKGSLILIGGDPGIGKSTILLQICGVLGKTLKILYVSGEESKRQIKLRATRLNVDTAESLFVLAETNVERISEEIKLSKPDLVMIDSIQTMNFTELNSSPGSVAQIRECTNILMSTAKMLDIPTIIVGHVTKEGSLAGPKVLEHMVDAVLYFEGDKQTAYRILRAVKNRYGSTNEIGVFQMGDKGLMEVENPSLMLLSGRPKNVSGTCVACTMEGTRPILAEVQGLATTSGFGNPRRMATGFDYNRLYLLLAVLEKRAGYFFSNLDAYINVVGGLKLDEPAADLAVAMALVSSLKDIPMKEDAIVFGEIGLAGEIRSVSHADARVAEAARLGFHRCVLPYHNLGSITSAPQDMELVGVRTIRQAFEALTV
ncbi:MAG: DNA repair protein RadA [Acutalibacteraceae bacterium]